MWRAGRDPDQDFSEPGESLYYRCRPEHVEDGHILPEGQGQPPFSFTGKAPPGVSVNRGRYSQPEDVLVPGVGQPSDRYDGYVVACLYVRDVPTAADDFRFRLAHVPEEDNYSHSEIRAFRNNGVESVRPPPSVRKWLRYWMAERARPV
jgi:hypothetical protein